METALIALYALIIVVLAVPAAWQIVEIWHHSHLMAGLRARVDLWEGFFGQLLSCPFCLTPWVSLIVITALGFGFWFTNTGQDGGDQPILGYCLLAPFLALGVSRLANVCNDLVHSACRTPRDYGLPENDED